MNVYRILLLGAGFWGSRWLKLINRNPRAKLAGIACNPEDGAKLAGSGIPAEIIYSDFRDAIAMADADIMVNVLPAALHFEADRLAIEKGMHVIAEKPLVATMDEALRLLEISAAHPEIRFIVSQNYRWRPHNVAIKRALDAGMIGSLESISMNFRQQEDLQGYREGLARPLLDDMSIHHFDLLRYFCGSDCESIVARTWRPSWSLYPGEPNLDAILQMKNGIRISYTGTWAARGKETSWDGDILLNGSEGCLSLDVRNEVRFYPHRKAAAVVLDTQQQMGELLELPRMEHTETEYCLYSFLDTLDAHAPFETTLSDNFNSFAMVAACREAADAHTTARVLAHP